ncbi:M48 family metallopeptidase [Mesorhizobium sp. 1B3]|uniref:M48 family metallopeptidase n=1 Tax=Mesorhizobium sp. 1B3 TaxID=3243599 RepID=UPI003D952660
MASDGRRRLLSGLWRPPFSGRSTTAILSVDAAGIAAAIDPTSRQRLASADFVKVQVSDRVGSIPRKLTFPDGSVFETGDNDAVDALIRSQSSRFAGLIHRLERFRPRLVLLVALVIGLCFAVYRFAVPALVEAAIVLTPPVVPKLMSRSVIASLDQAVLAPSELPPERQERLLQKFAALAAFAPRGAAAVEGNKPAAYTLNFRKGGMIGPNAFALPDGTIVLTDELVALSDGDEAILGVLAHEIGHVDHEHSLRQLYRAAGASALIMLIGGDIGSGTEDLLVQGSALLALSHSREAEREADRFSVELMHKAGHDPAAIGRFFELLRDKLDDKDGGGFLSTHPATPERIEETKRYVEEIVKGK